MGEDSFEFFAGSVLLMIFFIAMIIAVAVSVVQIIASWKIFKKAGKPGWVALIPYYNNYMFYKISDTNILWFIVLLLPAVLALVTMPIFIFTVRASDEMAALFSLGMNLLSIAGNILIIISSIIMGVNLAKKFGKDSAYGVLIAFLPIVGLSILAFGKAEYNPNIKVKEDNNNSSSSRVCSNCGALVDGKAAFCVNCGTRVD